MFIELLIFSTLTLPLGCITESVCEPIGLFEPTLGLISVECHGVGCQMDSDLPEDSELVDSNFPLYTYGYT